MDQSPFLGAENNDTMTDCQHDAPLTLAEYRSIARTIADDGIGRVLDWGCGYGYAARYLRDLGVRVSLFDYAPTIGPEPKVLPLRAHPDMVATVSSDPVTLPYPTGSFDGVLSLGTLEHVADPQGSLAEIKRVLVPGGRLYVYKLPNPTSYVEYLAKRRGLYYHGAREDDRLYNLKQGRKLLESSGFAVIEGRYRNIFPLKYTGRIVPARHHDKVRAVSDVLTTVPGLRRLSTNVEFVCVNLAPASPEQSEAGLLDS